MKILAIASAGGHWMELLRLQPAFENDEVIYVCTNNKFKDTVKGNKFFTIPDFSRWNKLRILPIGLRLYNIIKEVKPDVIITTGAAPGVVCLWLGKLRGCKTVWIESLCHAAKISLSGKLALRFADKVYTQWKHLAGNKINYAGNILE